jgi:serine/threonine-protein kinase
MDDSTLSKIPEIIKFIKRHDYKFVKELGNGACGQTILLHDDLIDEFFVCKKYHPFFDSLREELFSNFVREIKLLYQIHHPNLVRVFDHYLYPDKLTGFILMEYVDGTDIELYLKSNPEKVNELFLQVLDGFCYLEKSEILHRDIRPANFLVDSQGTLKIIDLGFGKKVIESKDFDKSISLNWWCQIPEEFSFARYDFSTEVYFVGKLFEKIIQENDITHFQYCDVLQQMCNQISSTRISKFSLVSQNIQNNRFPEIAFDHYQLRAYRDFADSLCKHVAKLENGAKYYLDLQLIQRTLQDAYHKFMLEQIVPDCQSVIQCFIDGIYYYRKHGFSVHEVKNFLELLHGCSPEEGKIILANIHTRLDTIKRYSLESEMPNGDDIPF